MTNEVLISLIGTLTGTFGVAAWFWYDKKIKDGKITALEKSVAGVREEQVKHASIFVTEDHVRNIIKSEIAPLRDDMGEVKDAQKDTNSNLKEVMNTLTSLIIQIQVENGIKQYVDKESKN